MHGGNAASRSRAISVVMPAAGGIDFEADLHGDRILGRLVVLVFDGGDKWQLVPGSVVVPPSSVMVRISGGSHCPVVGLIVLGATHCASRSHMPLAYLYDWVVPGAATR